MRRAGTSPETVGRLAYRRAIRQAEKDIAGEDEAAAVKPARKRAAVAGALMLAAELTLFAVGFGMAEAARVIVSDPPAGACIGCQATK